jgi:hypothetical protein
MSLSRLGFIALVTFLAALFVAMFFCLASERLTYIYHFFCGTML